MTTGFLQFLPLLGVSRMKRMDNSFQCCIKDGLYLVETAYVVQTRYANHPALAGQALKVLCSKGMVLNVQAKGPAKSWIRYV